MKDPTVCPRCGHCEPVCTQTEDRPLDTNAMLMIHWCLTCHIGWMSSCRIVDYDTEQERAASLKPKLVAEGKDD